ncbi:hypothetical protein NAT65_29180, partial [Achromobacter xylosoxidans]|uniref:hypothetical protein n=1 Tax=Alcaligenes xylosoxydans xylosoxydans TaxID=85698 RepID=UPI00203C316B
RREQIETVVWGGKPEKQYAVGNLGPGRAPRGAVAGGGNNVTKKSSPRPGAGRRSSAARHNRQATSTCRQQASPAAPHAIARPRGAADASRKAPVTTKTITPTLASNPSSCGLAAIQSRWRREDL